MESAILLVDASGFFYCFATARVHWRFSCVEKMFHPQQPALRLESMRWIDTTNRHCLGENLWYYLLSAHKMKNRERSNWSTTHLWWPCPNVCIDSSRGPDCCKCTHRWILTGITRHSIEYKHPSVQYRCNTICPAKTITSEVDRIISYWGGTYRDALNQHREGVVTHWIVARIIQQTNTVF